MSQLPQVQLLCCFFFLSFANRCLLFCDRWKYFNCLRWFMYSIRFNCFFISTNWNLFSNLIDLCIQSILFVIKTIYRCHLDMWCVHFSQRFIKFLFSSVKMLIDSIGLIFIPCSSGRNDFSNDEATLLMLWLDGCLSIFNGIPKQNLHFSC